MVEEERMYAGRSLVMTQRVFTMSEYGTMPTEISDEGA
jgi:hypothetical protein